MNTFLFPVKRELWEHRGALVWTPRILFFVFSLAIAIAMYLGFQVQGELAGWEHSFDNNNSRRFEYHDKVVGEVDSEQYGYSEPEGVESEAIEMFQYIAFAMPYMLVWAVMFFVLVAYALSCLSADRRDRSILFWKSLPIQESQVVLTKLFVAVFLIPGVVWLTGVAMSVALLLMAFVFAVFSAGLDGVAWVWSNQTVLSTAWNQVGTLLAASLWFLPLTVLMMLASAFAQRWPFLFVVLPLAVVVVLEHFLLKSHMLAESIFQYVLGYLPASETPFFLNPGWGVFIEMLLTAKFWIGTLVSAGMITLVIWLRENRFD